MIYPMMSYLVGILLVHVDPNIAIILQDMPIVMWGNDIKLRSCQCRGMYYVMGGPM